MIIALTNINPKHKENCKNLKLFKPNDLSETYQGPQTCSSDLLNPNLVLKKLELEPNYLKNPPFCYIRSYAPIWEYYLVALFLDDKDLSRIIKKNYPYMRLKPKKNDGFHIFGKSYNGVGNKYYTDWKHNYARLEHESISKEEKERIEKLKEKSKKFVKALAKKGRPIRQYKTSEKSFIMCRKKTALAFLDFLIHGKLKKNETIDLIKEKPDDRHLWLLEHYENSKQSQTYKHILSVSLLMCLYGYKEGAVTKKFCKKVRQHLSKLTVKDNKNDDLKERVEKILSLAIQKSSNQHVIPPLAKIYKERDRLNIQQRLGTWMQLLKGVTNAQNEA